MAACGSLQHVFDKPLELDPLPPLLHPIPLSKHINLSNSNSNSEALSEAFGFESFDDVHELNDQWERRQSFGTTRKHAKSRMTGKKEIPPPISSIGRRVCFESYRCNGRLILKEVKIPTQELLHAYREDGRLKLQVIQVHDQMEVNTEKAGNHENQKAEDNNTEKNEIKEESA